MPSHISYDDPPARRSHRVRHLPMPSCLSYSDANIGDLIELDSEDFEDLHVISNTGSPSSSARRSAPGDDLPSPSYEVGFKKLFSCKGREASNRSVPSFPHKNLLCRRMDVLIRKVGKVQVTVRVRSQGRAELGTVFQEREKWFI